MIKKLLKRLVIAYKFHKLARKKSLRQQHNDKVVKSILNDLEERNQ